MTALAILTQLLFVDIVAAVTGSALFLNFPERCRQVTFLTGHNSMQAEQRKTCHVMIKTNMPVPSLLGVTALTLLALLAFVDIIGDMTAIAVHGQLIRVGVAAVTGFTAGIAVPASQGKLCFCIVVESHLGPPLWHMT